MKSTVRNYSINPTASTITLPDYTRLVAERLLLIVNVTRQTLIYQFNLTAGVSFAANVISFPSLAGTLWSDDLNIVYDNSAGDPVYDAQPVTGSTRDLHGNLAVPTRDADLRGVADAQAAALESMRFAQQMSTGTGYGGYGYGSYGYGS